MSPTSTTQPVAEPASTGSDYLQWVPLGLWFGGALALLRAACLLGNAQRNLDVTHAGAQDLLLWNVAGNFPGILLEGMLSGLIAAVLAHRAADMQCAEEEQAGRVSTLGLGCFSMLLMLFSMSGFPLAPPAELAHFHGELALDDLGLQAFMAFLLTATLFNITRWLRAAPRRLPLHGSTGAVLAFACAIVAPFGLACQQASRGPSFTRELQVGQLVASENVEIVESVEGASWSRDIVTPAVWAYTDSGDKSSLVLPPGTRLRIEIPECADAPDGELVLRVAFGLDLSTAKALQRAKIWDGLPVLFEVHVNGERIAHEEVICLPESTPTTPNGWDGTVNSWHHAGGTAGLKLRAGDVLELATSLRPGAVAPIHLADIKAAFGDLILEHHERVDREHASADAPSIVMIVMDTQRADRMSCYGYERPTTPNLDRLAERGVLFDNAYSTSSWTWPATASLLTGRTPDEHGVLTNEHCTLALELDTLAEALQGRGYTTAGFSCNPLIGTERFFDQGFEFFDARNGAGDFRMSDEVMPDILRWVEAHAGTRFFLYLHLADPHVPHRPHPEEMARLGVSKPADWPEPVIRGHSKDGLDYYGDLIKLAQGDATVASLIPDPAHLAWVQDAYDASVATGDRWVGTLLNRLSELGLEDSTIVAFTGDHGEELLDHGHIGHGHGIHRELTHVPLIMAGPGIPQGERIEQAVSNRHLAPTLARLGGASLGDIDDAAFLLDANELPQTVLYQTSKGLWPPKRPGAQELYGLRDGNWVLHLRMVKKGNSGTPAFTRLYETDADPGERLDLSQEPEHQERLKSMRKSIIQQRLSHVTRAPATQAGVGKGADFVNASGYGGEQEEEEEADQEPEVGKQED